MTTIRAGLYGLIVADALGVPAESRTREDLRKNPITGMIGGGIHEQPAGYWSDDSSMTLCLADSIGKVGYYHTHDIMARFNDWSSNGAYTPGGKKFDIPEMSHGRKNMSTSITPERKMIDIHMHLIPGVDDGAMDMEMALVMMIRAKEQGISKIIATPHSEAFHFSKRDIRATYQNLTNAVAMVSPDMKVYLGCEVYCEADIMEQVLELLDLGVYPTMNGTKCVLMEFSQWVYPENTVPCVGALVQAGYKPIIAHMERYKYLRDNMNLVDRFRELGALIQLNAYSLFDEMDDSIKNWARQLVQERKADFLGTDAHRTYHRPPSAAMGLNWLYENVEQDYADAIAWKNAEQILCRFQK